MAQLHSLLLANHRPYADVYADAATRLAATGFTRALGGGTVTFTADDLYKKVLQLDTATEWILTAITPTWVQVSGAGALANDSVTNALLANMAQATIKGRASGAGTGDPTDLTGTQVKTILAIVPGDITGFDTQVRTSRLDQMAVPTADLSINSHKLTNVTDPSSAQDAATKAYVDSQVGGSVIKVALTAAHGSDDTWTGTTIAGLNAGATIAQWETVYLGASSTWLLADANGSGTYPARGLATAAYVNTNAAIILVHGTVRNDAWAWTPGGTIYLSGTAGGLTQTAPSTSGDKVQQVGFALTADIAFFDFNSDYLTVT